MRHRGWWAGVAVVGLAAPWAAVARDSRGAPSARVVAPEFSAPSSPLAQPTFSLAPVRAAALSPSPSRTPAITIVTPSPSLDASALSFSPIPDEPPAAALTPVDGPPSPRSFPQPLSLAFSPTDDEGVYTLPTPPKPGEGSNNGGVKFDLSLAYLNHYVYRGVDHSITRPKNAGIPNSARSKGNSLNLEIQGRLEYDLGKLPHPFVGLFANVYDADPKSRFQEIRPFYGVVWTIKPFTIEAGGITYIYPEREGRNTAEGYGKFTLNDAFLFNAEQPLLSPYFYAAYDYDKNNGWYFEAGVTHNVYLEDLGLTLTFQGDAAYILKFPQQFVFTDLKDDTGFQHFDVGMDLSYSLNHLFDFNDRFGEFDLLGYLFYTGKLNSSIRANNIIWGGAGIGFKY